MLDVISRDTEISAHLVHMKRKVDAIAVGIGQRIRRARKALGKGQAQMARDMGVTAVTALRWEKGEAIPPLPRLRKIAELLRVPIEQLVPPEFEPGSNEEPPANDPEELVRLAHLALAAAHAPDEDAARAAEDEFNAAIDRRVARLRSVRLRGGAVDDR